MECSEKQQRKGLLSGYSKIEKKRLPFVALLLAFPILQFLIFTYTSILIPLFWRLRTDGENLVRIIWKR